MSYVYQSGSLGDAPIPGSAAMPCPPLTHQVCLTPAPGKPTTADMCSCRADTVTATQAAISSTAKYNWGLIAGIGIAAVIVYKVATG